MPGKVGVKIKAGRNLPVMDKSSDTTDAYVEIKLGCVTHKTDVCRKSLNPQWNTKWFRFEVDDAELQDEPLQIRLMDHDTYSANDAIGKVNISLNPLCLENVGQSKQSKGNVLSGWIPVFDTMHGIRGEVYVIVKVGLFSDVNRFRQSSCGIPFFHSNCIPAGYRAQVIHGFVEELVVNDDPEYQWIDKIRTPRASNEARQVVFLKLSGQVQRKMGLKAINMGANAVVGYTQCLDLEGDVGVVARGIGTAVTLIKDNSQSAPADTTFIEENIAPHLSDAVATTPHTVNASTTNVLTSTMSNRCKLSPSPSKSGIVSGPPSTQSQSQLDNVSSATTSTATTIVAKELSEMYRRSSDSDLSITPKGNSFCVASERLAAATAMMRLSQTTVGKNTNTSDMEMLEYPFLTMTKYPPGFIQHLGATVSARSVKLLERVPNPDEPEVRDSWWTELRMEIRSHTRALGCNVVLGYSESTAISDDVCVLSATGTAAIINMVYNQSVSQNDIYSNAKASAVGGMSTSLEERELFKETRNVNSEAVAKEVVSGSCGSNQAVNGLSGRKYGLPPLNIAKMSCSVCHIPYNSLSVPFNVKMKKCTICHKGRVPDVLLATIEPDCVQITGRGCLMQAQVVRAKKDLRSELNAKEISDGLPFLEYELHRVLINKLKAKGMNAIFGLKTQVSIGDRMIALIATGTALFLAALPVPQVPQIVAGNSWTDKQKLNELQKKLQETFERNQEVYQLKCVDFERGVAVDRGSDTDDSDEEGIEIDLNSGNKDTCVLEIDDIEDVEILSLLMESYPPEGFHVVNTQLVPGLSDMEAAKNLQMFTQIWRAKLEVGPNINSFSRHFQRLLQTIYFKLRNIIPCAICDLRFKLDLPESDQIQLLVTGMAIGLADVYKAKSRRKDSKGIEEIKRNNHDEDYIFPLDEDHIMETTTPSAHASLYGGHSLKIRRTSPSPTSSKINTILRNRNLNGHTRYGIDITPLSFIPGGKIDKYLGNLNFFFIRESTSIRENGGISGFVHGFITELLAVVRAHIAALGGNAMVSFYMTELILFDNQHKNQGQCLISIGGDAVFVSYFPEECC